MQEPGMAVIVGATGEMGQVISNRLVQSGLKVVLVASTGAPSQGAQRISPPGWALSILPGKPVHR